MLKRFVEAGAPQEIVYQQKPHLGTDVLIGIVETMRHQIEEMGGAFRFESKVTDLCMENGRLCAVEINDKEKIPAEVCVLALGHSARDTFSMIHRRGDLYAAEIFCGRTSYRASSENDQYGSLWRRRKRSAGSSQL